MECPRPIKSVLCRFYATWSSRTRTSMRIQKSEGLGSRLGSMQVGMHLAPRIIFTLDMHCIASKVEALGVLV